QTADGNYIMLGSTTSFGSGAGDIFLLKADSLGNLLWAKAYGGTVGETGNGLQITSDGGYIIVGTTSSFGGGANDVYLIKTDSSGNLLWPKAYGGAGQEKGVSVKQTIDGGFVIGAITNGFGAGNYD